MAMNAGPKIQLLGLVVLVLPMGRASGFEMDGLKRLVRRARVGTATENGMGDQEHRTYQQTEFAFWANASILNANGIRDEISHETTGGPGAVLAFRDTHYHNSDAEFGDDKDIQAGTNGGSSGNGCTDNPTTWMENNGKSCATWEDGMEKNCNKKDSWKNNKFCQQSCFDAGFGYDGDDCSEAGGWVPISQYAHCHNNDENIELMHDMGHGWVTPEECQAICLTISGCKAIDWNPDTWCGLYASACTLPKSAGCCSYKLASPDSTPAPAPTLPPGDAAGWVIISQHARCAENDEHIEVMHDMGFGWTTPEQCQALCLEILGCKAVDWLPNHECQLYASACTFPKAPGCCSYKYEERPLVELARVEAEEHCIHSKWCQGELVKPPQENPYDEDWMCTCVADYMTGGNLPECSPWKDCMDNRRNAVDDLISSRMNQASDSSLLQLGSGQHQPVDLDGCKNPFLEPDCGCENELRVICMDSLGPPPTDGDIDAYWQDIFECQVNELCKLDSVCSTWKCGQCDPTLFDLALWGCGGSFLAVREAGEATKAGEKAATTRPKNVTAGGEAGVLDPTASSDHARASIELTTPVASDKSMLESWAEKARVSVIADKMSGRRQPFGNISSAEPMTLLDKSVSGKCGARTAR